MATAQSRPLTVVVTDQVFPSIELEKEAFAGIGARLVVADGTPDGVVRVGAEADAILNTYMPIDGALLDRLPDCRIVARYGVGVDNIDIAAATARGVVVTNVPDYGIEEVATHALGLLLASHRRIVTAHAKVASGGWGLDGLRPITRLSELTVGVIGLGRIGRTLASYLVPLGCRILAHDPAVTSSDFELASLDDVLQRSDLVSLHLPLTPRTTGIIDAARLGAMKPGAILVNTSRGGLVVLADVIAALRAGTLGGAALDVFETEPVDAAVIDGVPHLIATPHMAYYSEDALHESQVKAVRQVVKVLTGESPDYAITV